MTRPVPGDACNRQRDQILEGLGIQAEPDVLAPDVNRFLVAPGGLVAKHPDLGAIARRTVFRRRILGRRRVHAFRPPRRYCEHHRHLVAHRRKQVGDVARFRKRVAFRHVEDQTVRKDSARMDQ